MEIQVPEALQHAVFWLTVGGGAVWLWAKYHYRSSQTASDLEDHERLCETRHEKINETLVEILQKLAYIEAKLNGEKP